MYETLETLSLLIMAASNLAVGLYFLCPRRRPWGVAAAEEPADIEVATWDEFEELWRDVGGEGGGA